ncbi:MAG: OFA family MFS transporter [Lachnoclostridium sp.]|nr:OFA family MFS transporter [Lachnoclostridium sp.]
MKNIPLSVKRYLFLLNGVLLLLLLGVGYAWSIFVGPLEAWFGWSRTQTSLAFTLNIIFFAVGVIFCGILSKTFHYERIAQLAGLMLAGGFLLTTQVKEIWQLYLTYSVICGTSVGMCYSAIVSTLPLWFRDKSGFATGILIMGYALSTTLLGPVCQKLLSGLGWQTTFFILGVVDLVVIVLGGFFIRMPKAKEFEKLPAPTFASAVSEYNATTKEMLKSPTFYFIFIYIVTLGSVGLAVINHISPLLTGELGMTAATAAMVVSIGSLFNGFGRLATGVIFDKIGGVATTRFLSTTNIVVVALMYLAYRNQFLPALIVLVCVSLFLFGGNSSTIPSVTRGLYGNEHFASNYSVIMLNSVFSPIPASIVGVLQERTGTYEYMFYLLAFCAVSAVICAWSARENK